MKKWYLILLVVFILFSGCSDVYERVVFTDIEDYEKIWELPERRAVSKLEIFPKKIEKTDVSFFYCDCSTYFPVGTGYEILLSVNYDETNFYEEITRLASISKQRKIKYDINTFIFPAYVATLGYDCCNEYALVDENDFTIHYLYLQLISEENIEINADYLPEKYDFGDVNGSCYTIYSDDFEEQYGY